MSGRSCGTAISGFPVPAAYAEVPSLHAEDAAVADPLTADACHRTPDSRLRRENAPEDESFRRVPRLL
jgi:hypothetical protein